MPNFTVQAPNRQSTPTNKLTETAIGGETYPINVSSSVQLVFNMSDLTKLKGHAEMELFNDAGTSLYRIKGTPTQLSANLTAAATTADQGSNATNIVYDLAAAEFPVGGNGRIEIFFAGNIDDGPSDTVQVSLQGFPGNDFWAHKGAGRGYWSFPIEVNP